MKIISCIIIDVAHMERVLFCLAFMSLCLSCEVTEPHIDDNGSDIVVFTSDVTVSGKAVQSENDRTVSWNIEDSLGIYCFQSPSVPNYNIKYVVQSVEPTGSVTMSGNLLWGEDGSEHIFYAYYPFEKIKAADPERIKFSVGQVQDDSDECYARNLILTSMPAKVVHLADNGAIPDPVHLDFVQQTASLRVNVTLAEDDAVSAVELYASLPEIAPFATEATIDITDADSDPEYSSFVNNRILNVMTPNIVSSGSVFTADMVIFPADMTETEYQVKVHMASGKVYLGSPMVASVEWSKGGCYSVDIDLNTAVLVEDEANQVIKATFDDFSNGTFTGQNGWSILSLNEDAVDRTASIAQSWGTNVVRFNAAGGQYADYDVWVVSPLLDLSTEYKNLKFAVNAKNCNPNSELRIYLSDGKDKESLISSIEITEMANIPYNEGSVLERDVYSEIDLSSYSGHKYIAFRYTAANGQDGFAAYYEFDNVFFGCFPSPETDISSPIVLGCDAVEEASITVSAESDQVWTAMSDCEWITVPDGPFTGTTALKYSVSANSGYEREGKIFIESEFCNPVVVVIRQDAAEGGELEFDLVWNMKGIPGKPAEEGGYGESPMLPTEFMAGAYIDVSGLIREGMSLTGKTPQADSWGGNGLDVNGAEITGVPAAYAYFTMSPKPGHTLSLTSLDWNYLKSGSGNTGAYKTLLQYSTDGVTYYDIMEYSVSGAVKTKQPQAELSKIPDLQNITSDTVVYLRLVPYGATASGQNWYITYLSADDPGLVIKGIID